MNNLVLHIEYLLLGHDCVIVPGLGAFIATHIPARVDFERGEILPPSRGIMFNQAVITDDGLLANSIVRKTGLSFEDARQVIFREVDQIRTLLASQGSVNLGNIGTLSLGEENTLLFSPSTLTSSICATPGFDAIKVGASAPQEKEEETMPVRRKGGIGRKIGKIAAAIAVTAAVAVGTLLSPFSGHNREQRASVVPVETLFPKTEKQAPAALPVEEKEDTVAVAKEEKQPEHYLIVATFATPEEAERYASAQSTADFPLTTVASRKVTRVAAAVSTDRDSLRRRINTPSFSTRFPNSWIWTEN